MPEWVEIMAWRRPGDMSLPEPMMTQFSDVHVYKIIVIIIAIIMMTIVIIKVMTNIMIVHLLTDT